MNDALSALVAERLATASLDDDAASCVLAALEGAGPLEALLGEGEAAPSPTPPRPTVPSTAGATIESITVQGFRGIGPRATLTVAPGPGLTLVIGRNGSGKSSFAEGLEILLTGENLRWRDRTKIWREGWRNLHAGDHVAVEASLLIEGDPKPTTAARTWAPEADLDEGEAFAQRAGAKRAPLSSLGWDDALVAFRPFLSYNELGSMLDEGPSKLYDALSSILGLEELVSALNTLRDARLARERLGKDAKGAVATLAARLEHVDDARASAALEALRAKAPDVDLLEKIATGTGDDVFPDDIEALSAIALPKASDVRAALEAVATARAHVDALAGTDAERDRQTADLLERAIAFHEGHGDGDCPVCGSGTLDVAWRSSAGEQVVVLRASAQRASAAHNDLTQAEAGMRALRAPAPATLTGVARESWEAWLAADADDLLSAHESLVAVVEPVVAEAKAARTRRDAAWTPVATDIASTVEQIRQAQAAETATRSLKAAEAWLKQAAAAIRDERFEPIATKVASIWETLRQQSSVELGRIALAGAGGQRRVTLDVTIDGVDGAALGVMSQGELHALALSLFLPRATLPESPFRFVVIDDPVQSMDPARVDGLARVLEDAAADRQVIVFTHDDRLPEAARRLGIAATVIEVSRKPNSAVELRGATDPVQRLLDDAFAVAWSNDLPARIGSRVVPGQCRLAIEAACLEVFRRKRIARGVPHADVEQTWDKATTTNMRLALALYDDGDRGGDVMRAINAIGRDLGDAYKAIKAGAHEAYDGDLHELARAAERICKEIRKL